MLCLPILFAVLALPLSNAYRGRDAAIAADVKEISEKIDDIIGDDYGKESFLKGIKDAIIKGHAEGGDTASEPAATPPEPAAAPPEPAAAPPEAAAADAPPAAADAAAPAPARASHWQTHEDYEHPQSSNFWRRYAGRSAQHSAHRGHHLGRSNNPHRRAPGRGHHLGRANNPPKKTPKQAPQIPLKEDPANGERTSAFFMNPINKVINFIRNLFEACKMIFSKLKWAFRLITEAKGLMSQ